MGNPSLIRGSRLRSAASYLSKASQAEPFESFEEAEDIMCSFCALSCGASKPGGVRS